MRHQNFVFFILITFLLLSTFSYIDYAVTALLIMATLLYVIYSEQRAGKVKTYRLNGIMFVYLCWLYIVSLLSPVPHASISNLVMLAGLPAIYLASTQYQFFSIAWPKLRILLLILGSMLSMWAFWQVLNHIGYGYATGPLNDRNAFAALLNLLWFPIVFMFVLSVTLNGRLWTASIWALGVFLINTALFATTSRGGILTWVLLLPFFILVAYRYSKSVKVILLVLGLSFLSYLTSDYFLNSTIADRTFALTQDASTYARLQIWQSTFNMALDKPLFGTGWGTFAYYYPAFRLAAEKSTAGFFAHNDYLQFAAEGGVIALIILLVILWIIIGQLRKNILRADQIGFECTALLLAVLALFVHALVNFIFYFAFMSVVAGLYLARVATLSETPSMTKLPELGEIRSSVKKLMGTVLLLFILSPYLVQIIAQLCLTGSTPGLKLIQVFSPSVSAFNVSNLITSVYPNNGLAQEYLFRTYEHYLDKKNYTISNIDEKRSLLQNAIMDFDAHRARNANIPAIGNREVKLILDNRDIANNDVRAYQILEENLKADPYDGTSMVMLARLQSKQGKQELAIDTLKYAYSKVIKKRDQMLVRVEYIRQLSSSTYQKELDAIEKDLEEIKIDAETGRADIELTGIYEKLNTQLSALEKAL